MKKYKISIIENDGAVPYMQVEFTNESNPEKRQEALKAISAGTNEKMPEPDQLQGLVYVCPCNGDPEEAQKRIEEILDKIL